MFSQLTNSRIYRKIILLMIAIILIFTLAISTSYVNVTSISAEDGTGRNSCPVCVKTEDPELPPLPLADS